MSGFGCNLHVRIPEFMRAYFQWTKMAIQNYGCHCRSLYVNTGLWQGNQPLWPKYPSFCSSQVRIAMEPTWSTIPPKDATQHYLTSELHDIRSWWCKKANVWSIGFFQGAVLFHDLFGAGQGTSHKMALSLSNYIQLYNPWHRRNRGPLLRTCQPQCTGSAVEIPSGTSCLHAR